MKFRYEELDVCPMILKFIDDIYFLTLKFPSSERYALATQIQRAAISIYLNVAEGSARTRKEFARFTRFSMGSLLEVHAGLKIALNRSYITPEEWDRLQGSFQEIWFKLWNLRESQNALSKTTEPNQK
jgi:four helix bundle protein